MLTLHNLESLSNDLNQQISCYEGLLSRNDHGICQKLLSNELRKARSHLHQINQIIKTNFENDVKFLERCLHQELV